MLIHDLRMWYLETYIEIREGIYYVHDITIDGLDYDTEMDREDIEHGEDDTEDMSALQVSLRKINTDTWDISPRSTYRTAECLDFFMPSSRYVLTDEGWKWVARRKRNTYKRAPSRGHYGNLGERRDFYKFLYSYDGDYGKEARGLVAVCPSVLISTSGESVAVFGGTLTPTEVLPPPLRRYIQKEVSDAS